MKKFTYKYNIYIQIIYILIYTYTPIIYIIIYNIYNIYNNIDNKSGLLSVKEALTDSNFDIDSTQCMVDDLELCLTFNNSKFKHQHFLKTDGTAQGSISCSYADIVMAKHDSLVITFHLNPSLWKRFRDDIFVLWEHSTASLSSFLDYLNTMEIVGNTCLEFLDLKLNEGKIRVDIYVKSTNSFSYTTPNTNYPKNNICNITRGIDLRLRRICDDDKTFEKR